MDANNNKSIWLIGEVSSTFPDGTPTVREVLRVYFYHRLVLSQQKKPCVNIVSKNLIEHWKYLGTATIELSDVVRKLNKIIEKYDSYKKSMHRDTQTQRLNEQKFVSLLNQHFDIAPKANYHHNKEPTSESISVKYETVRDSDLSFDTDRGMHKVKRKTVQLSSDKTFTTDFEMYDDDEMGYEDNKNNDFDFEESISKYQKSKLLSGSLIKETGVIHKIINSPGVSSALDRTNISVPKFTILCAAIAGAVGEDLNDCTLSTSTCRRRRKVHRDRIVTVIKDDFITSSKSNLVLHWDGKKLRDTTNDDVALRRHKVERLAVVVSGVNVQKIITIAKTDDGSGLVISDTVYEHVAEWQLLDSVVAICTDTTPANTGRSNGSVVLFQQLMERHILYFACRHHVLELVIGAVFEILFGETTGPSPEMFENFKRDWPAINQASFKVS